VGDLTFDQDWPAGVLAGFADRVGQFSCCCGPQTETVAVVGVERGDQPGVVPVLDVVVRAIMDLRFDDVAACIAPGVSARSERDKTDGM
jgi:hypothetical protein